MLDIENYEIFQVVNFLGLVLGLAFGIIAQKNQFCFSGSIKDYALTKSTRRTASVIIAIITAIITTQLISMFYEIDLTESVFYRDDINYFSIIFGGALFGAGMIIADGCSSRHLIKFAQGDPYSLISVIFIGIFAYATTKGILYDPISLLSQNEYLIKISSMINIQSINIFVILVILFFFLWFSTKKLSRILELYDGVLIGLLIAAGWYVTGMIGSESMERLINLSSFSFVYPTANTLELVTHYQTSPLSFGVSIIIGVLLGAFFMSKINKKYSFGCTSNLQRSKIKYNMLGGAMMGVGGVLAIGCTVGQGLTGISTLALSSVIAIISIMGSGYITATLLAKKNQLPMCFLFEWKDEK